MVSKLKRRLERHLKKIDESPLKRPPTLIDGVAALLDCALDKYDELLERKRRYLRRRRVRRRRDGRGDAALKEPRSLIKPSPADTSTSPYAEDL